LSVSAVESTPGIFGFVPGTAKTGEKTSGPTTTTSTSEDKDMFLQLLVAQMKYQDPSNPADSSEFLAQTAQFTALEKMQEVADQTSQLVALQVAFGASSMVGRTVTYPAADGTISTGVVDSVQFGATGPVLKVDGNDVFLAQVQSVANGDS
jgi:flagellar basal-body rod modification protein FlgD